MLHFARWKVAAILGVVALGFVLALPSVLPRSVVPEGWARRISLGLDLRGGSYLLLDGATGRPAAVLDGTELTRWRTAAASALAAEELGGSLSCVSTGRGQGATFTLELPIRKEEAREEGAAAR